MLSAARSTSNLLTGSLAPTDPGSAKTSSKGHSAKYKASRSKRCKSLLLLSTSTTSFVKSSLLSLLHSTGGGTSNNSATLNHEPSSPKSNFDQTNININNNSSLDENENHYQAQQLPDPIKNLLNELYRRGPTTVGIFRKSPNAKHCRELRHKLETDSKSSIEQFQVTVIASVFKEWLRSLPDCLLMSRLYPQWMDVAKLIEPLNQQQHHLQQNQLAERRSECLKIVSQLLDNLNKSSLTLLSSTISVLWHIASNSEYNKMSASNLGVCVGQSLLNDEHQSASSTPLSSTSSTKTGGAFSGIGSSSTFGKRHRRTRSQCLLSSTLSLSSASHLSSAYLESNGAQEAAKYVPILVAFMIENAPHLFGQDVTEIFKSNEDKRQDILSTSVTESTTSSSPASSSTSGIHSDSPAFSNELESRTTQASTSNSSPVPSTVSSPSPVISPTPSSPEQGETTLNRSHPQCQRRQHALHHPLHNNRYVVYSTTSLGSLQYQPSYDRYMWYHGNSLDPQRSHVMSLRDYYLSLQQQDQQQQQQQQQQQLLQQQNATLLRNQTQQMAKNQATTSSHALPATAITLGPKSASGKPSQIASSTGSNAYQRRCQFLSRRQQAEPTLVSYHTLDDRLPDGGSMMAESHLAAQTMVTSHLSAQRPQPRLARIRQNLFNGMGPTSAQQHQMQQQLPQLPPQQHPHLNRHHHLQQQQQQHLSQQQKPPHEAQQAQLQTSSSSPLTRYVRGAAVGAGQTGGKLKLGASSGSSSDERDSSDDSDLNEGWTESTMV